MAGNMFDGEFFIPEKIGLKGLQDSMGQWVDPDHYLHTIECLELTDAKPDQDITADEFVSRWMSIDNADWFDAPHFENRPTSQILSFR